MVETAGMATVVISKNTLEETLWLVLLNASSYLLVETMAEVASYFCPFFFRR